MTEGQPKDYDALLAQAHAAYHALRLDEALTLYQAALDARPDDYDASLGMARTLTRRRDQEGARVWAERCIARDPSTFSPTSSMRRSVPSPRPWSAPPTNPSPT